MPRDEITHPLDPAHLDPAYAALPKDEQREAWWRGTEDKAAWRAGDDVDYAYDGMFTEGLNNRTRTDEQWARIAYYLAAGVTIAEVARHFRLSRSTIWRALQRSPGLRRRIVAEREMLRRESDSRFVAMRHAVLEGLSRAINAGNIRAILWAAQRLELGGPLLDGRQHRGAVGAADPDFRPIRRPTPRRPAAAAPAAPPPSPVAATPPESAVAMAPVVPMADAAPDPVTDPVAAPTAAPPAGPRAAEPVSVPDAAPDAIADTRPDAAPPAPRALSAPALTPSPRRDRHPRMPVRRLARHLRAMVRLAESVDERLVPFPAGADSRMQPWLDRAAGEELNVWRPATMPRH